MIYFRYTNKEGEDVTLIPWADLEPLRVAKSVAQREEVEVTVLDAQGFSTQYDPVVGTVDRFGQIA